MEVGLRCHTTEILVGSCVKVQVNAHAPAKQTINNLLGKKGKVTHNNVEVDSLACTEAL